MFLKGAISHKDYYLRSYKQINNKKELSTIKKKYTFQFFIIISSFISKYRSEIAPLRNPFIEPSPWIRTANPDE